MELYTLFERRNDSRKDFKKFLSYMVTERNQINSMSESIKDDFLFHYGKIPDYFEEYIQQHQNSVLEKLARIEIASKGIKEAIQ